MWILTEGLEQSQLDEYYQLQSKGTEDEPVCCFEGSEGTEHNIKAMTNGFARVIIWSKFSGIEYFWEGRFKNGL